ncbi:MAG: ABC transporter ATP-binding protein [Deltaproteobacteria bacterium]|nr:ABC transporter ATP-binding protein [Deltaproteobacteria bacterium]
MSPASLLALEGLAVARGGVQVVDVPSFRLEEREFVAVIGPNGAGKSSLLLAMMSLLPRAAGRILHRGREIRAERDAVALRRRMALVLQDPLLFDATVYDNVAAGLRLRGLDRRETRRRVSTYLERFRLADMADRAARRLSGGEARRVNLARALAVEPEVVLLDEPFSSLDLPTRQAIADDLERTIRETNMAAVLVTHDQSEALRLSDRIVVMNRGAIVQSDAPAVVMNHPVDGFVASCMGMETILDGVVRRRSGYEIVVEVAGREIDALGEPLPGESVYCCIRPEQVLIEVVDPTQTSSARNVFPARIASVTSVGPYLKLRLDCGFPLVAHVTGESFAALALAAGKSVFASVKATAIHVIRRAEGSAQWPRVA